MILFPTSEEVVKVNQAEIEQQLLAQSADLYAEVYAEDAELQALTDAAIAEWPE